MITTKRPLLIQRGARWTALMCLFASMGSPARSPVTAAQSTQPRTAAAPSVQPRTFATPEDAVKSLIDVVKKSDVDALLTIFGQEGRDLLASSDPATARMNRQVFAVATAEQWHLVDDGTNRKTLIIGNEEWPFPVPLVKQAGTWRFDTAAGKEEVIARRIGHNELAAIATLRAYVTAQERYAAQGHDGNPPGLYAAKLRSDPGKENGLYWPVARGQKRSPLGDLVADAAAEGRPVGTTGGTQPSQPAQPSPYRGYFFKLLTAQGASATGGAKPFIVKGQMSGGHAMVAWPAQYNVTGVMTFIVSKDGVVREKNLGPDTDSAARKMSAYNPDTSWKIVK